MQLKGIIKCLLVSFIFILCIHGVTFADVLDSDWIGTLDKSYELSWQQCDRKSYNGNRTYFFLEYTYLMKNTGKYPTYCIEYYLKGPRNNDQYGKQKLVDTDIPKHVRLGLMAIMKNGYPNVKKTYGTTDTSEAYYATSAAIHIWTMYYGIDEVAGNDLGWFLYRDGFRMNKKNILNYISDNSTRSTASGWHAMGPNDNAASTRTWDAAMNLLIDAIEAKEESPKINLSLNSNPTVNGKYLVYDCSLNSNLCTDLKIKLEPKITGLKTEYKNVSSKSTQVSIYIPLESVNSNEEYKIYGYGNLKGASDANNYYYLYHLTGSYQSMVYLDYKGTRTVNSDKSVLKIPQIDTKVYYDLNYSEKNYIRGNSFQDINLLSYSGDFLFSGVGDVSVLSIKSLANSGERFLKATYNEYGKSDYVMISTYLNSDTKSGFAKQNKTGLTFSGWIKADGIKSLKLFFENSSTIYETALEDTDQWQYISVNLTKSENENNNLCIYPDNNGIVMFKNLQLEEGLSYTEYIDENSPTASPVYTNHKVGNNYQNLYNSIIPEKENYVFLGWNTKKNGRGVYINNDDIVTMGNKVLYAIWTTKKTYNVYFHYTANGGEALVKNGNYDYNTSGYEVVTVPTGSELEFNMSAFKTGYEFIGWSLNDDLKDDVESNILESVTVKDKDIHLYANFKKVHKVNFHYYDEKSDTEQIVSTVENISYNNYPYMGVIVFPGVGDNSDNISIPKVNDYTLKGWSVTPYENEKIDYKAGDTEDFNEYSDYYAVYKNDVTVKFYDNYYDSENTEHHKGSSYLHKQFDLVVTKNCRGEVSNGELTLPENVCEISGYEFYGWSDSKAFDGSVVYLAKESGNVIEVDSDMRFYALYAKESVVSFYDYNYKIKNQHLEDVFSVYEYMNYNGDVYAPEIIMPYCCPESDDWTFDGWSLSDTGDDDRIAAGTKLKITKSTSYYATYKGDINVSFNYLINDEGNIKTNIEEVVSEGFMDSYGTKNIEKVLVPVISSFDDNQTWRGIGYSDVSSKALEISHQQGKKYIFEEDTELFAIYSSEINIEYHDYSIADSKELIQVDKKEILRSCGEEAKGVTIEISDMLTDDIHDESGWTDTSEYVQEIKYYPKDNVLIENDAVFYAVHIDNYELTCNDLSNNEKRIRKYSATSVVFHDGNKESDKIQIPDQGDDNIPEKTGYWSSSEKVTSDYWSDEYISLDKDIEINAIYKKPVTVIFDANGGMFEDGVDEISVKKYCYYNINGKKLSAIFNMESTPTKQECIFAEMWNTKPEGNGTEYFHGESIITDEDMRVYAIWEILRDPYLSTVDRYFFVGETIAYEDIIKKIIALDTKGKFDINNVKVVKVNNRDTSSFSRDDFNGYIKADNPRIYFVDVEYNCAGKILKDSFILKIIDSYKEVDRLRYISIDYVSGIDMNSKWNTAEMFPKLMNSLTKETDEAKWTYVLP